MEGHIPELRTAAYNTPNQGHAANNKDTSTKTEICIHKLNSKCADSIKKAQIGQENNV